MVAGSLISTAIVSGCHYGPPWSELESVTLRIIVDASAVGTGGGGICTFFLGLLSGWNDAGFRDEWRIIGMRDLPVEVDALVGQSGEVRRGRTPSAARRILTQQIVFPIMCRKGAWSPDVILATTPVVPLAPVGVPIVAVVYDLRFLRFPHEFGLLNRWYRQFAYGYGLRRADGVIAISEFTRQEVLDTAGRQRSAPQVAYLGVDHVDRWASVLRNQGHGVTFAQWSNKRPDLAIRTWSLLRDNYDSFSASLHVIGATPSTAIALTRLVNELHMVDLVRIHPYLNDPEYRTLFASSSVVLLPSTMEGFGLPVAEAQRLGIPVVTTAVGAALEVGGDAALYSHDASASSFAELCAEVLFDPVRRAELVRRGEHQSQRFTWRATAEVTRHELERSVQTYGAGPRGRL